MLTYELAAQMFSLDHGTGIVRWKVNRRGGARAGNVAGCARPKDGRWVIRCGKLYLRSRIVFLLVHGFLHKEVDHKDRDHTNDRPGNLRAATRPQQLANATAPKGISGARGVVFCKMTGRWRVRIGNKEGGRFADLGDARERPVLDELTEAARPKADKPLTLERPWHCHFELEQDG